MKLTIRWDKLDKQSREEILVGACVQERFAHYEWDELQEWIKDILIDSIIKRSHSTVKLVG